MVFIPGADTLDHDYFFRRANGIRGLGKQLMKFQLGFYPRILSIEILGGFIFRTTGGHDHGPMFYSFLHPLMVDGAPEIPHMSIDFR